MSSLSSRKQGFYVVIVAAGSGLRFGGSLPKQYMSLAGEPVLRHSLQLFSEIETLQELYVVIDPTHREYFDQAADGIKVDGVITGGATRQESVKHALQELSFLKDDDLILIHDAARPLVKHGDIHNLLDALMRYKAASVACRVVDTLSYADADGIVHGNGVNREGLWTVQTPQGFHYSTLSKAHAEASRDVATDDCGLVRALGEDVCFVEGGRHNFKITHSEDLTLAEKILRGRTLEETRTGSGFDVHAFDSEARDVHAVRLCGIDVPHDKKLKGHSDADVGLHALTDAILGAIGAGDIGQLFPPSNPAFKNMDSTVFLLKARELMENKSGRLVNADITLICEAPKIGPHRETMEHKISEILGVAQSRVNVKATTTESLGFTGRKEGIAAQAVVSIAMKGA